MHSLLSQRSFPFSLALSFAFCWPHIGYGEDRSSGTELRFEENKGQVTTTTGGPATYVRYRLQQGSTSVFLLNDGIAYQFERTHTAADPDNTGTLETYRMDMRLLGAGPEPRITTEGRSMDATHYYTHDVSHVYRYERITYHDVYPGIDWVIHSTATGFKYDFVVHAGADPDLIRMRFDHHEELYVDDAGRLVHGNRMGRFVEAAPVSFQNDREVATSYHLEDNVLRLVPGSYDHTQMLIIDPDRIWATYYGGTVNDEANAVAIDTDGNVYMAGSTYSNTGIASGGHQLSNGGTPDAFLVKFTADGVRLWGTYYGGTATEDGTGCAVAPDGSVYLSGNTQSSTGIAFNGFQNEIGGNSIDAFLVKFMPDGTRSWATYYGHIGAEYANACAVDMDGNVYLAGGTTSNTSIASDGHQTSFGGGTYDAYLVKFDAAGTRLWATYHGGNEPEVGMHMAVAPDGSVYLVGNTFSQNNIAWGTAHQSEKSGGKDSFIMKYSASGQAIWGSYYGGTGEEIDQSCAVAPNGDVYLSGSTNSLSGIADNGHQNTIAANHDAFLVKFTATGTRIWGTYYGGESADYSIACAVGADNDVFLAGRTGSQTGIAANGYQNELGGWSADAFLVRFHADGTRAWGTYYGGSETDEGRACVASSDGHVYLAGRTGSTSGIAYNGHQNTFEGTNHDAFLVKFHASSTTAVHGPERPPFEAFPNPTSGVFTIQGGTPGQHYAVIDATGRTVQQGLIGSPAHTIDVSTHPQGSYLLRVRGHGQEHTMRLVKW